MSKELLGFQGSKLKDAIQNEFELNQDHIHALPINIRNTVSREPLFIVAGVQIFDSVIHNDSDFSTNRFLVFQPSIRLRSLPLVPGSQYTFSSFINVASLAINRKREEHKQITNHWIDFLDRIGIPKISINTRKTVTNWGRGEFNNEVIDIFSRGIHVGDSVYRTGMYQSHRNSINISDISFGYERLLFSMGSNDKIFDNTKRTQMDLLRTLSLILGSGILPGNKSNINRKTQSLIKNLDFKMVDLEEITRFYSWWNQFTSLQTRAQRIHEILFECKYKS